MIKFQCASCSKKYAVKDQLAGRRVKCKICGSPMSVPAGGAAAAVAMDQIDLEPVDHSSPPPSYDIAPQASAFNAPPPTSPFNNAAAAPQFAHQAAPPSPAPGGMMPSNMAHAPVAGGPPAPVDVGTFFLRSIGGLIAGLVAAVVCGAIWGLVAYWTNFEIGWLAIGMGVVIGVAIAVTTPNRTPLQGIAAVAFVIFSLYLGKTFSLISYGLFTDDPEVTLGSTLLIAPFGAFLMFGPFDLLWLGLGGFTAWKTCTTPDDDE